MLDDDPAKVYGPGVRAAICYLSAYQHLPAKRLAEATDSLFGLPISSVPLGGWRVSRDRSRKTWPPLRSRTRTRPGCASRADCTGCT
jgi:hypothetical protein